MKKKPTKARSRDLRTRRYAALPGLSQSRGNCLEWPASGHLKVECISWDPELGRSEFQSNSLKLTKRLTGTLSSTSTLAPTGLTGLAGGTIVVQCDLAPRGTDRLLTFKTNTENLAQALLLCNGLCWDIEVLGANTRCVPYQACRGS